VNSVAVIPAISLTYVGGAPGTLSGFPSDTAVTVTTGGVATTYPAGVTVPYDGLAGDTISFGGVQLSGVPAAAGSYTIGPPNSTLTYDLATNTFSGFPNYLDVTVTPNGSSTPTTYPAGTAVPYTDGSTISYGGISFLISGSPANGDTFKVENNLGGIGDNRNALQLAGLQTKTTLDKNAVTGINFSTYQGAYGRMVNSVGNKTHELDVAGKAEGTRLEQAVVSQQTVSGVNLDEEAANLLRYQQAYQAAAKVIQTADTIFGVLLSLGG
jgi:flagellar hook-associated protein 1 FlgK